MKRIFLTGMISFALGLSAQAQSNQEIARTAKELLRLRTPIPELQPVNDEINSAVNDAFDRYLSDAAPLSAKDERITRLLGLLYKNAQGIYTDTPEAR